MTSKSTLCLVQSTLSPMWNHSALVTGSEGHQLQSDGHANSSPFSGVMLWHALKWQTWSLEHHLVDTEFKRETERYFKKVACGCLLPGFCVSSGRNDVSNPKWYLLKTLLFNQDSCLLDVVWWGIYFKGLLVPQTGRHSILVNVLRMNSVFGCVQTIFCCGLIHICSFGEYLRQVHVNKCSNVVFIAFQQQRRAIAWWKKIYQTLDTLIIFYFTLKEGCGWFWSFYGNCWP